MEYWTSLPWWIRYPVAMFFPTMATLMVVSGAVQFIGDFRSIGGMYALGFMLLVIGPTKSDKNGYNF